MGLTAELVTLFLRERLLFVPL